MAARHLAHFGYGAAPSTSTAFDIVVVYPHARKNRAKSELYNRLCVQLEALQSGSGAGGADVNVSLNLIEDMPALGREIDEATGAPLVYDIVVDALFGFSFKGWRGGGQDAPYDTLVETLQALT